MNHRLFLLGLLMLVCLSFYACDDDDEDDNDDAADDDALDDDTTDDDIDDDSIDDDDDDTGADDTGDDDLDDDTTDDDTADDDCDPLFPDLLITGHRGATVFAPENTIPSFEAAMTLGAYAVEIDVRHTSDGHYVLMHDDTVDRTTNGSGPVEEMTLAEIKQLLVKDWMYGGVHGELRVPTLIEALEAIDALGGEVDLDMKTDQVEGAIQEVVDNGFADICFVYSGDWSKLERVRTVTNQVRIQPASSSVEDTQAILGLFDPAPEHIEIDDEGFTDENVEMIHDAGSIVFMDALGFRDAFALLGLKNAWRSMMEGGVDIIQTDFVGALVEYRDSLCE